MGRGNSEHDKKRHNDQLRQQERRLGLCRRQGFQGVYFHKRLKARRKTKTLEIKGDHGH